MKMILYLNPCTRTRTSVALTTTNNTTYTPHNMNPLLEKMQLLKLFGMARAFRLTMESGKIEKLTADEIKQHLIESE